MQKRTCLFLALTCALLSGCDVTPVSPAVATVAFVTATLPPTTTAVATVTPLPPTVAPTLVPVAGTTTSEVNVRVDTSTASESLGTIPAFSAVQVIGRDASGNWVKVIFKDAAGWVRADLVQLAEASAEIPVVDAESGTGSAGRGVIVRGVNVRSGPGTEFESLGLLSPNDVVSLFGKDPSGAWLKIGFPAALLDGTGWVAADYVQAENIDALPIVGENAAADAEATRAAPQTQPATGFNEGDSAESPLAFFDLSTMGAVQFQGEVSEPVDEDDWLGFTTQNSKVVIQVLCQSGSVQVELSQIGAAPSLPVLTCGETRRIPTQAGAEIRLHVYGSARYQLKLANE